ncbi:motility associated factor glycosyltransferase family protein [Lysinibacillus fusiformis]|uniref:motility associated factor glycosyltransferase family protein n=1 Tax=Lysinibacillus fusiformis TaxID=28031 RepID=UPI0018E608A5|nr:6-hydroxymethylpterin diphosphokinase MptE-like protein [Lysinibacillus fusiformis]MBI6865214.1 motility associated factor glycosyltransferase family protein [Lysinibacillus fusiformis]
MLYDVEYLESKTGDKTIKINNMLIHSKYNPLREAEQICQKKININQLNIVFGIGNGFLYDALLNAEISKDKVLFIEPLEQLKKNKYSLYPIIYGHNSQEVEKEITQRLVNFSNEINIICTPNYDKVFAEEYVELLRLIKGIQNKNSIYKNTITKFADLWQENIIRNMLYSYYSSNLSDLEKSLSKPVVVASGGPSLTKQILLLKKIRPAILLIASGSTIHTLLKNEIEPDYIISIDGGMVNYERHFKNLSLKNTELIYSITSKYEIQQTFMNRKYAFFDNEVSPQSSVLKEIGLTLPRIKGGGSVAHYALSIARYISNGPIALIGQDLAYTNNQTHAEGNKNMRKIDRDYIEKRGLVEVDSYYDNEKVLTDYAFLTMRDNFEEIMKDIQQPSNIYNCTEGGIKIKGMEQQSFEAFCNAIPEYEIVAQVAHSTPKNNIDIFISAMRKEKNKYKEMLILLKTAERLVESTFASKQFPASTLKKLDSIDNAFKQLLESTLITSIKDPIIMRIMTQYTQKNNETLNENYARVYFQQKDLYTSFLEVIEKCSTYVDATINEAEEMRDGIK